MASREREAAETNVEPAGPAERPSAPGRSTLVGADGMQGDGLPYRQKSLFERSLRTDLSDVRVHTGVAAEKTADAHDARAFAVGRDIHFAKGEYKPGTREGDQLLAHEVAHTAQQGAAKSSGGELATTVPGDAAEKNADTAASAMVEGKPAEVSNEPVAIARKGKQEDVAPQVDAPAAANGDPAALAAAGPEGDAKKVEGNEEIGELTAERVGAEEEEGSEAIGAPQNLEQGKHEIAAKGGALPPDGGAEELKAGAPKGEGDGGGGGGGGEMEMSDELSVSIAAAQADAKEASAQATAEANAYKAEMKERRDRFENEQNALTLENLKAMPAADKRSTLLEMGYDNKSVKKMKDAELDGIISGKVESETRKTKILGMDPEELAGLSAEQKMSFLQDLGIERKDLDKIGAQKAAKVFDDVMRVAHVPGQHKVKVKVKGGLLGKSWELNIKVDAEGSPDIEAKKKGGFLSKLWGWVKAALPIIAILLVPLTAGASLVALSVYQTVTAIAAGDWLGAIIGGAGAFIGVGATLNVLKTGVKIGAANAANAFGKLADVAGKVKNVATAAKTAMAATKAKSPGGLLGALSGGAAAFADFATGAASKFGETMRRWSERLDKWSKVVSGGEKVIAGVKTGDPAGAIAGAFDAAAALASKPQKQENGSKVETSKKTLELQKYSRIAGYASAGQRAAKSQPPDYGAVVDAAMGIAGELKTSKKLESATKITSAASRLTRAIQTKNPGELAAAALGLAEAIQLAKIEDGDEPGVDGKLSPEDEREKVAQRYAKASSIVKFASAALNAAAAKPRPNYIGALDAATQLIADLTENKKLDQAAELTSKFDAWTTAVRSKNENAIIEAGKAFGEAINGMKDLIVEERDASRKAALAKMAPGESLGDDGGNLPSVSFDGLVQLPGTVEPNLPGADGELTPGVTTSEEVTGIVLGSPRSATPGANYEVVPGDTLSGIAQRFKTSVSTLRSSNPQLVSDQVYRGQKIFVPGAEVKLTPNVTTEVTDVRYVDADHDGKDDATGRDANDPVFEGPGAPGTESPNKPVPRDIKALILPQLSDKAKIVFDLIGVGATALDKFDHPLLNAFSDSVSKLIKTYAELTQDQNKPFEAIKDFTSLLENVAQTTGLAMAFAQEMAKYESRFGDPTLAKAAAASVKDFGKLAKFGTRFNRFISLPVQTIELMELTVETFGYNRDFSGATIPLRDQLVAATNLSLRAGEMAGNLEWAHKATKLVLAKYAPQSVQAAVDLVWNASARYGTKAQQIIVKYVRPILQKLVTTESAASVISWAQRMAASVAEWGPVIEGTAGKEAVKGVFKFLGMRLGSVARIGLSGPFAIAYEVAMLEKEMAEELYAQAMEGFSQWLTPMLFGKNINALKSEVRNKPTGDMESCDEFIDYVYYQMLPNARSDVRAGWPQYIMSQGSRFILGGTFANQFRTGPYQALKAIDFIDLKMIAASTLKTLAIEYIDREYRREFIDRG